MGSEHWMTDKQTDPRPTSELIALALVLDEEEPEYNEVLQVLHFRGTREVLDAAQELCRSLIPKERFVGVDILMKQGESARMLREAREYLATTSPGADRYQGAREHYESIVDQLYDVIGDAQRYPKEAVSILLPMLDSEDDPSVFREVVLALGWYRDYHPTVVEQLARLVNHPDADVRLGLAMRLAINNPVAIEATITLSVDENADVRNWATFALGQLSDDERKPVDSVQIRDALFARTCDEEAIVRYEALRGLVERDDRRVIELMAMEPLEGVLDDTFAEAIISAGKRLGDAQLLPALLWLKEHGRTWGDTHFDMSDDDDLQVAIARCLPETL
jgi:hypothetical protein